MKERFSNTQSEFILNPDPFIPNFNDKLGEMISHDVKELTKESMLKASRFTAITSPLVLSACSTNPDQLAKYFSPDAVTGLITGFGMVLEEIIEKDNRSVPRKILSVGIKFAGGYAAGHAISHNVSSGDSWMSPDNITSTLTLIPAAYALANETKFSDFIDGIRQNVEGKISESKISTQQDRYQRRVERLVQQTTSPNLKVQSSAWEELNALGIDKKSVTAILQQNKRK